MTTLTKRMAEDLTQYYQELGVRVRYLHSDIETLERVEILRDLRRGEFDVLVGINLLREGLDLPEVSLVAILDADKEGFPAVGRVAHPDVRPGGAQRERPRHHVRRHGDRLDARRRSARPSGAARCRRRTTSEHGITPQSIVKQIDDVMSSVYERDYMTPARSSATAPSGSATQAELDAHIAACRTKMRAAAANLDFEKAAALRDEIKRLRNPELGLPRPARRS